MSGEAGDYIAAFARKHRLNASEERELRDHIASGPKWVRWFLEIMDIRDDYPRASARAASEERR